MSQELIGAGKGVDDPAAVLRELQRRHFPYFLMGAFPLLHGGALLTPNWHLDAIAFELEQIGELHNRHLLVNVPPRSLKSVTMSVAWVAWRLGVDPTLNFVCVSYASDLANKHGSDCRDLMLTPWYRRLFPETKIKRSRSAISDYETTRGGGRLSTSVGGTLTGRGGDIIIIDDPINPVDAHSDPVREKTNDWYRSTLSSRLNNKATGAIIVIMQRLHEYDLSGMLLDVGGYKHLCLPAIATEDATYRLTRGHLLHRKEGDVLSPALEPLAELERQRQVMGSTYFTTQYQQAPTPAEGNIIKRRWLKHYGSAFDASERPGQIVQSWDTAAGEGEGNAYSVCVTAHVYRGMVHILDVYREKLGFPELRNAVERLARENRAKVLLIENASSGVALLQNLEAEKPAGVPAPISIRPERDKVTRMHGASAQIEAGQLLLPTDAAWLPAFRSELLTFPRGRFADQADALSQLMNWVQRQQAYVDDTPLAGPILVVPGDDEASCGDPYACNPDDAHMGDDDPWLFY